MLDDKAVKQCLEAFVRREYDGCVRQALVLLRTQKTHELFQVLFISLQRLGRNDILDDVRAEILAATAGYPWVNTLLRLTLGEAESSEVVAQAEDDAQLCQARYYTASRLLTLGLEEEARAEFEACMAIEADCVERHLARFSITRPPPGEPRKEKG